MNFMDTLQESAGKALATAKKNQPEILLGLGIIFSVCAVVEAARKAPKAAKKLEEKQEEKGEELTVVEKVTTVLPDYAPAIALEAASIGCSVASGKVYRTRYSDAIALAAIADNKLRDYRREVASKVPTRQEADIRQAYAEDRVKETEKDPQVLVEDLRNGKQKFCDPFGRLFITDINVVKGAVNEVNASMQRNGDARLNELYYQIGLSQTNAGDSLGWNYERDGFIEPDYLAVLNDDTGEVTIYIDFGNNPPNMDYYRYDV